MIEAVIIGHWYKVLRGLQHWNTVGYFYPASDTLGYNDGLFLYGLISLPFRFAGLDLLRTQEAVHVVVKTIGFISMLALLDRIVAAASVASIVGASVFVLIISSSNQASHGQLFSVCFAPLAMLLLLQTMDAMPLPGWRFVLWGSAFAIFLGMWLMTSFYMAWFFLLFCAVACLIAVALDWRSTKFQIKLLSQHSATQFGVLTLAAIVSCAPFLIVYGPKRSETGGHSYTAALYYTNGVADLFNIGPGSLVWGSLFQIVDRAMPGLFRSGESMVGFTPDILACTVILAILVTATRQVKLSRIEVAFLGAGLLLLIAPMSLHGISPWRLIYKFVPGASGVRVVSRLWILLSLPAALVIAVLVDCLWVSPRRRLAALGLSALVITGQISAIPGFGLNVAAEQAKADSVPTPPAECQSFFLLGTLTALESQDRILSLYHDNVLSMQIADRVDRPTIGGFASFSPKDWDFAGAPLDTYLERVHRYAVARGLSGLCSYDFARRAWSRNPFKETKLLHAE